MKLLKSHKDETENDKNSIIRRNEEIKIISI